MPDISLSQYRLAQLRLEAWRVLDGWGIRNSSGDVKTWDFNERTAKAKELADKMLDR